MIYNSLRVLPMVTLIEIYDTGNLYLLTDDENTELEILIETWSKLNQEYNLKYNSKEDSKLLNIIREVDYHKNRYVLIKSCCDALFFQRNETLIQILKENNYLVTNDNYISDIEKVIRESEGILNKISKLQEQLPKEKDVAEEYSIIDVMASYMAILGTDFDFYTTSVEKFHSIEKAVQQKVKAIEKSNKEK